MGAFFNSAALQYFSASGFTLPEGHTLSMWVRNDVSGANQCMLENFHSLNRYHRFESDALVPKARRKRTVISAETVAIGPAVALDDWSHVLIEREADAPNFDKVSTDGVAGSQVGTLNSPEFTGTDLAIGARVGGGNYFSGFLAEIGIYAGALAGATRTALIAGARPNSTPETPIAYIPLLDDATVVIGGFSLAAQNGPIDFGDGEFHPTMFDMITTSALDFDRPPAGVARGIRRGMHQ